jgi:hypothetical protein
MTTLVGNTTRYPPKRTSAPTAGASSRQPGACVRRANGCGVTSNMENSMHIRMFDMSNGREYAPPPEEVHHTTIHRLSVSMEDDDRFSFNATITEGSCQLGEEGLGQSMNYGEAMNLEDLRRLRALIDKSIDIMEGTK